MQALAERKKVDKVKLYAEAFVNRLTHFSKNYDKLGFSAGVKENKQFMKKHFGVDGAISLFNFRVGKTTKQEMADMYLKVGETLESLSSSEREKLINEIASIIRSTKSHRLTKSAKQEIYNYLTEWVKRFKPKSRTRKAKPKLKLERRGNISRLVRVGVEENIRAFDIKISSDMRLVYISTNRTPITAIIDHPMFPGSGLPLLMLSTYLATLPQSQKSEKLTQLVSKYHQKGYFNLRKFYTDLQSIGRRSDLDRLEGKDIFEMLVNQKS